MTRLAPEAVTKLELLCVREGVRKRRPVSRSEMLGLLVDRAHARLR